MLLRQAIICTHINPIDVHRLFASPRSLDFKFLPHKFLGDKDSYTVKVCMSLLLLFLFFFKLTTVVAHDIKFTILEICSVSSFLSQYDNDINDSAAVIIQKLSKSQYIVSCPGLTSFIFSNLILMEYNLGSCFFSSSFVVVFIVFIYFFRG